MITNQLSNMNNERRNAIIKGYVANVRFYSTFRTFISSMRRSIVHKTAENIKQNVSFRQFIVLRPYEVAAYTNYI